MKFTNNRIRLSVAICVVGLFAALIIPCIFRDDHVNDIQYETNPDILANKNKEDRAKWAARCIVDMTTTNKTPTTNNFPDYCTQSALKLFPEKNWIEVSRYNSILYKKH